MFITVTTNILQLSKSAKEMVTVTVRHLDYHIGRRLNVWMHKHHSYSELLIIWDWSGKKREHLLDLCALSLMAVKCWQKATIARQTDRQADKRRKTGIGKSLTANCYWLNGFASYNESCNGAIVPTIGPIIRLHLRNFAHRCWVDCKLFYFNTFKEQNWQ